MYRILMCAPDYFGVEYVINPWMEGELGGVDKSAAREQWDYLHRVLSAIPGVEIILVRPQPGLPDLVFTANAATVRNGIAVPSCFRHPERQGEEPIYREALREAGCEIRDLAEGVAFEGAGDALFYEKSATQTLLIAAHGYRTDAECHPFLAEVFRTKVVSVALADPRLYHLDTCFCPLPRGYVLWYPPAFTSESQEKIRESIPAEKRYAVSDADATAFACNAVGLDRHVVLNHASDALQEILGAWGFTTHQTPLSEFIKAGGSSKCLMLRLA